MKPEQERVKTVLVDTVSLLCKNGLHFNRELKIQAVIGVSVDFDDVFIVHINETITPNGSSSNSSAVSSSAVNTDASLAMVPYGQPNVGCAGDNMASAQRPQMKRPMDIKTTPMSAAKRARGGGMAGMSPMSEGSRQKAKQQLRFPSPGKVNASPGRGGGMSSPSPLAARMPSGSPSIRGSPRGGGLLRGRGGSPSVAGRGMSPRGLGRGASPRGMVRGSPRGAGIMGRGGRPSQGNVSPMVKPEPGSSKLFSEPPSQHSYGNQPSSSFNPTSMDYGNFNMFNMSQAPTSSTLSHSSNLGHASASREIPSQPPSYQDFNYPMNEKPSNNPLGDFGGIDNSVEFGLFSSSSGDFGASNATQPNMKSNSGSDAGVIFIDDDATVDGTGNMSSTDSHSSAFPDPTGMYPDMSGSGDMVQHITRKVTITTNIQGQNVKYEQVQHATLPVQPGPDDGNIKLDNDAGMFSNDPLQSYSSSGPQYQSGADLYGMSDYGQPANSMNQPMWDRQRADVAPSTPTMRQPAPRPQMTSPGMPSSVRMPVSKSPAAGRGGRPTGSAGPRFTGPRPSGQSRGGNAKKSASGGATSSGMPPLAQTGIGGGSVEDGSLWELVARFVCSVPGCGQTFTKKQNLQRHQSQKHGRPKMSMKQEQSAAGDEDLDDLQVDDFSEYYDDGSGGYM